MKDEGLYKRLMARCRVDGDCMLWPNKPNPNGGLYVSINGEKKLVRRVLWEALHGEVLPDRAVSFHCESETCVLHLMLKTVSQVRKTSSARFTKNLDYRIKMAKARKAYRKFSDEAVAAVRTCGTSEVVSTAAAYGMSEGYAYMLRRGKFRRDYSNPFVGLGA